MGWLSDTFDKVFDDPFNLWKDKGDKSSSSSGSPAVDPLTGVPELSQMGLFKSMSDFRLRRSMGIGGSRGGSRVVNPIGSNPNGAPAAGLTGGSPVSGMPVATSPGSTIDSSGIPSFGDWMKDNEIPGVPWRGLRTKSKLTGKEMPGLLGPIESRYMEEFGLQPKYDMYGKIGEPRQYAL